MNQHLEKILKKETSVEDILPDKQNQEKEITDKLTINKLIQELTPKEQDVVILRYFKEETQSQVAKRLGISQVQVSRIEKKGVGGYERKANLIYNFILAYWTEN